MAAPAANQAFEEAIKVTPVNSHRYSAILRDEWCIGTVPNGGYTTAVLYRLAITHFAHTHPTRYDTPATPISMQLAFLRRTAVGPAVLEVQDTKLGARTSTIHVALLQPSEKGKKKKEAQTGSAASSDDEENLEVKVAGYITVSPVTAEVGVSAPSNWTLLPESIRGSGPHGRVNLAALQKTGRDGQWVRLVAPFPKFRRASQQVELYGPDSALGKPPVVDQWARFRPGGNTEARWTNEAVAFLVDMFPMALDGFDSMGKATKEEGTTDDAAETESAKGKLAKYWYPTVTLNIDFKKRLPASGVEWLYSRVQTKSVRNGRTDLDVVVLDEQGDVVALSTQVGLVVDASRNIGQRKSKI
ncbi:hypothetical protein CNMCM8980_004078 [Aspergillus fumigatiaffinis]|uniref:Thioesterase family protein n=1 Tax=Aspergillus fumigatiaffinis TaxID=340414 RepID=A0A8H4ECZ8_9EURO|nr:hypothetical protein CNMCM5878_004449 [Aspergillus fumigatiaffinis]KAF4216883.1 hypothetical protein CNMCM6457_004754 [Aspergillus fumigatiaffinis]KAF4233157.1 hypothetical protein CNMCM6805_009497 [Aspergillus fumigatiaffinis]KAF4233990.1 hypothetical protein CNMCM8980_004078 [Aspergillus fumigatiaffinis]